MRLQMIRFLTVIAFTMPALSSHAGVSVPASTSTTITEQRLDAWIDRCWSGTHYSMPFLVDGIAMPVASEMVVMRKEGADGRMISGRIETGLAISDRWSIKIQKTPTSERALLSAQSGMTESGLRDALKGGTPSC